MSAKYCFLLPNIVYFCVMRVLQKLKESSVAKSTLTFFQLTGFIVNTSKAHEILRLL